MSPLRRFFCIALVACCVITLTTIRLVHRKDAIGAVAVVKPIPPKYIQPPKALAKPMLSAAANATVLSSGTLSLNLDSQEAFATHVFDVPFEGTFQIQILFEWLRGGSERSIRMHVLVNYVHRMELQEVEVDSATHKGWWTVGSTALSAGNNRISVQRIDKNFIAVLTLHGIRINFMGASRFLGGEDCASLESAPDVFFSSDVYKCPELEEIAFLDDKNQLRSKSCAQSDLVVLVPNHNSTLLHVSLEKSQEQENLIVQCKDRDVAKPASFITRIVQKHSFPAQGVSSKKISVIHVFMDSIARAVGIMKLPKTMRLLRNIRVSSDFKQWQLLDMRGYNVLGGGTNRNVPPMVSGTDGRDTPAWNEPGWLFNDFRNNNYVTGFVADECVLDHNSMVRMMSQEWSGAGSKFKDELKKELREKADALAHHTLYNVICGIQEYGDLDDNWYSGSHLCFSGKPVAEHLFDYGRKFLSAYADHDKFLWFSIQEGHEPKLLRVETIDESLHSFLEFVLTKFSNSNTIVNLIADHGLGYGEYWTSSDYAKSQEKKPMWMMLVSPALAESPMFLPQMAQARKNEGRLVTPFDVYATMQHIMSYPGPVPSFPSDRRSIFQPLPDDRTCHTLKIPPEWCTCTLFSSESLPKGKVDYDSLAAVASSFINQQASNTHKKCRQVTASMIDKIEVDKTQQHYLVLFTVAPTAGKPLRQVETFEARFSIVKPPEPACGVTKACFGAPFTNADKKMLSLRVGMRFDDAYTIFQSLYGVVVRGEMLWEFFSWSSDEDNKNEFLLAYTDDTGKVWESKNHTVNVGITSNWRWWRPSFDEMKVGRHSLTLHTIEGQRELVAEFIFYAVNPPDRGITIQAPLMAMGKKSTAGCAAKKNSIDPVLVIGSSSVTLKTEISLLQLWDKSSSFSADDCSYTAEIISTCGDQSKAKKQVCPGKFASTFVKPSRLLLQTDESSPSSYGNSSSMVQLFGLTDEIVFSSTFPTSVCTRISEAACEGVWRHHVYNSANQKIGQSLIFVGGESWGIPSDRSIIGDLDHASVSVLLQALKFGAYRDMHLTKVVRLVGWKHSSAFAALPHDVMLIPRSSPNAQHRVLILDFRTLSGLVLHMVSATTRSNGCHLSNHHLPRIRRSLTFSLNPGSCPPKMTNNGKSRTLMANVS